MCILSFVPEGITPLASELLEGAKTNRDGSGWAIVSGGRIVMGHSMDAATAVDAFMAARTKHDGPALFHSRYATHGTTDLANVHPFVVGRDKRTVLAHNGILPADAHPKGKDRRSDTRVFAQDIFPKRYRDIDRPATRKALETWLGGNKVVILSTSKAYKSRAYILGVERGEWSKASGVWHSNGDFRPWVPRYTVSGFQSWQWEGDKGEQECIVCGGTKDLDLVARCCFECDSCQMCGDDILGGDDGCMCYRSPDRANAVREYSRWWESAGINDADLPADDYRPGDAVTRFYGHP